MRILIILLFFNTFQAFSTDDVSSSNVKPCTWRCQEGSKIIIGAGDKVPSDIKICIGEKDKIPTATEKGKEVEPTIDQQAMEECIDEDNKITDNRKTKVKASDIKWSYSPEPKPKADAGGEYTISLIGKVTSESGCTAEIEYSFDLIVVEFEKIIVWTETSASPDATTPKDGPVGEASVKLKDVNGNAQIDLNLEAFAIDEIEFMDGEPKWKIVESPDGAAGLTNDTGPSIIYTAEKTGRYKFSAEACGETLEIIVNVEEDLDIVPDKTDVYREGKITFTSKPVPAGNEDETEWQFRKVGGAWQNGPKGETFVIEDEAAAFYEVKGNIGNNESEIVKVRFAEPTGVGYGTCVKGDETVAVPILTDIEWKPAGVVPDGITIKTFLDGAKIQKHKTTYVGLGDIFDGNIKESDMVSPNVTEILFNGNKIFQESVKAVNQNAKKESEVSGNVHALIFAEKLKDVGNALRDFRVANVVNVSLCQLQIFGQDVGAPVSGEIALNKIAGNVKFGSSKECCNDKIGDMNLATGGANFEIFSGRCDIPIYGIPKLASINVRIQANAALGLTLADLNWIVDGASAGCPTNPEADATLSGSIGGGISATLLGGAVVDASAIISGSLSSKLASYSFNSRRFNWGDGVVRGKVDGVFTVTILSMISFTKSLNIIPDQALFVLP